jgi:DNA invertase Pin-like site-specific DNA recombinase
VRAALYARVSTLDQEPENQLRELRAYTAARGWSAREYVDHGVSGARESRPALDLLLRDGRRRKFDVVVVWRLDRLGRSLKHLVSVLDDLQVLKISFISMGEGIDATTASGKLQMHLLAAFSEFERSRISERVRLGMARARAQGRRVGRPRPDVSDADLEATAGLSVRQAAAQLGVSKSFIHSWRLSRRASPAA